VIKRDILEKQAKSIFLGIGSNLGNRSKNILKAIFLLTQNKVQILKCSSYYESLSWPNPKNPKFLNIILKVKTNLRPTQLLKKCKDIETELGRKKLPKNSPRPCDIDIIDYQRIILRKKLILPHPRMHTRNFVLIPLFELSKDWNHPIYGRHIKNLILSLSNRDIRSIKQY